MTTKELIALEDSIIAGRSRFTVFRIGQLWSWVRWSNRPAAGCSTRQEAIQEARDERDILGLTHIPIELEL